MRLTINLDEDLYAMARSHAIATRTSLSKAVGDLLRRHTVSSVVQTFDMDAPGYFDPVLGFQVSRSGRSISQDDVNQALADEDLAGLKLAGQFSTPEVRP